MEVNVTFISIKLEDENDFYEMAFQHFRSINPNFVPRPEWKEHYFHSIMSDPDIHACWILADGKRIGFLIYIMERHRFLKRVQGAIREVYVVPEYRRKRIGVKSGLFMIDEMKRLGAERIYVDMLSGDKRASGLWLKIGFQPFTERYILAENESGK